MIKENSRMVICYQNAIEHAGSRVQRVNWRRADRTVCHDGNAVSLGGGSKWTQVYMGTKSTSRCPLEENKNRKRFLYWVQWLKQCDIERCVHVCAVERKACFKYKHCHFLQLRKKVVMNDSPQGDSWWAEITIISHFKLGLEIGSITYRTYASGEAPLRLKRMSTI